jgi:Na+/melibiose symporter-like transporter
MDRYWLLGQLGILIELVGAGFLVWCSFDTKRRLESQKVTYDGAFVALEEILKVSVEQFRQHVRGFLLLALGLVMQLGAGFRAF